MKLGISTTIVALSGQTGSGKTSLANALVQKLDAKSASFGSFVRSEAMRRGIEPDRVFLQNFGQALIDEFGPDEFVKEVLIHGRGNSSPITILEGVRSVEIWLSVQKLLSRSVLIYLDIEANKRVDRLIKRDKIDITSIQLVMHHPMEMYVPELRKYADLILSDSPTEVMVSEVMKLLTLKHIIETKSTK